MQTLEYREIGGELGKCNKLENFITPFVYEDEVILSLLLLQFFYTFCESSLKFKLLFNLFMAYEWRLKGKTQYNNTLTTRACRDMWLRYYRSVHDIFVPVWT